MGEPPDWYTHLQAARYLKVDPERLLEMGVYWKNWAIAAINEEAEAQKIIEAHNAGARK